MTPHPSPAKSKLKQSLKVKKLVPKGIHSHGKSSHSLFCDTRPWDCSSSPCTVGRSLHRETVSTTTTSSSFITTEAMMEKIEGNTLVFVEGIRAGQQWLRQAVKNATPNALRVNTAAGPAGEKCAPGLDLDWPALHTATTLASSNLSPAG